jgi:hypothetical protein
MQLRASRVPCVLALLLGVLCIAAPANADSIGKVRFVKEADTGFEPQVRAPSPAQADWMRTHYWRQKTYAPYFDSRTSWYPNAWTYKDAYAIYAHGNGEVNADQHPNWVLKDAAGNRLYIPFGCQGGTCPQFAGDIGNPEFRAQWIAKAQGTLAAGAYRGLFVDDVNMELAVSNGNGENVAPIDPRTGKAMTLTDWRRYMAEFMEQISAAVRAAHPGIEVVHNAIWFDGHSDPSIQRALLTADTQNLERGVNDDFHDGHGQFALSTFFDHIDWLHARGTGVVLDSYADTQDAAEYNLAAYFLVATERDGFRTNYRTTPGDWWSAYDLDLGKPRGARRTWNGLLRRDFERGYVLVNLPGGAPKTVNLPAGTTGPDGSARAKVTLPAASGRVVVTRGGAATGSGPAGSSARSIELQSVPNPRLGTSAEPRLARAALVRGRVRGAAAGKVAVSVERKARGHWRTVRHARVHLRKARFARLFRHLPKGTYRVRAQHRQSRGRMAHSSRRFQVRH